MIENIKLNFKLNRTNKLLFVLLILSQILSFIALLFSSSLMLNENLIQYSQNEYCIRFIDSIDYSNCIDKLSQIENDYSELFLDESGMVFCSYPNASLMPNYGKAIDDNLDANQAVVGAIEGRPAIGEIFNYNGVDYEVVGLSNRENIVELSTNSLFPDTVVYSVNIYRIINSKNGIADFTQELKDLFGVLDITTPEYVSFGDVLFGSTLMMLVVGVIGLSIITLLIGYQFFMKRREKSYRVLRLLGAYRTSVTLSILSEIFISTTAAVLIASFIYCIMDVTFVRTIISGIYARQAFGLPFGYYVGIYIIFLVFSLLSAGPALISLYKKSPKGAL